MAHRVGLAMLQGARHEHAQAVIAASRQLGLEIEVIPLRSAGDLNDGIDCLILPGGETTAMRIASESERLLPALFEWISQEKGPVLGTCAGAILMCDPGEGRSPLMHSSISRNSYGRQKESFQSEITVSLPSTSNAKNLDDEGMSPLYSDSNHLPLAVEKEEWEDCTETTYHGIFIRAPRFSHIGVEGKVIATLLDEVVGVLEGNRMALTFHPELTTDYRFHRWLLLQIDNN